MWATAFGLATGLVWLYLELCTLLAIVITDSTLLEARAVHGYDKSCTMVSVSYAQPSQAIQIRVMSRVGTVRLLACSSIVRCAGACPNLERILEASVVLLKFAFIQGYWTER